MWHYWDYNTVWRMIHYLRNREFAMLTAKGFNSQFYKRNMRCHHPDHFKFFKTITGFESRSRPFNFYCSLAKYQEGIPFVTKENRKDVLKQWTAENYKFITGYDFLLDIDVKHHDLIYVAYESAKLVKDVFDHRKVPYELVFSGRGFHFKIPYSVIPRLSLDPRDGSNLFSVLGSLANKMHDSISEYIDTSIYDSRRLCKVPFSIALYKYPDGERAYLCRPFADVVDFNKFNLSDFEIENIGDIRKYQVEPMFNCGDTMDFMRLLDDFDVDYYNYVEEEKVENSER